MKISIIGMGYVGVVSGACFASMGHKVTGVDINPLKINLINKGQSPIVESGVEELVQKAVNDGSFSATANLAEAVLMTDITLVCVGTPSGPNGALSLDSLSKVCTEIANALRTKSRGHVVVIRSTILPGTMEKMVIPVITGSSGRELGNGLDICYNPEFLREGQSIKDFFNPPYSIVGATSNLGLATMKELLSGITAPLIFTDFGVAEAVKYLSNIYHALKICFANEAGVLLKSLGIDSRKAMEIFCEDAQLNISAAYLRPGFAFGGSCLPKDLRAFLYLAKHRDVTLPMLDQVLISNREHIDRVYRMIEALEGRKIALIGLAFKKGTDDLRESPIITLAERLIGRGYEVKIYDPGVESANLIGSNKDYILAEIPHFADLLQSSAEETIDDADIIIIGHALERAVHEIIHQNPKSLIIDLVGIKELQDLYLEKYFGICW